jgi:stage II sporulation protein D
MAVNRRRVQCLAFVAAALLFLPPYTTSGIEAPPSLFAQAAQARLDRDFPSNSVSYVLLDAHSGTVLAERWPGSARPIPVGSLIKPFTALAYARFHHRFPVVICHGQSDRCWLPRGHGRLTLSEAIAQSCNAYFLALAREVSVDQANAVFDTFALPPLNPADKSLALAGLSDEWQVTPLALARAYARLAQDPLHDGSSEIFIGMRGSAEEGTARAVSLILPAGAVLSKTGTARCTHIPRGAADGFTLLLYPAGDPRFVLLTREHGVTGATTAVTAAKILRALEVGQQ